MSKFLVKTTTFLHVTAGFSVFSSASKTASTAAKKALASSPWSNVGTALDLGAAERTVYEHKRRPSSVLLEVNEGSSTSRDGAGQLPLPIMKTNFLQAGTTNGSSRSEGMKSRQAASELQMNSASSSRGLNSNRNINRVHKEVKVFELPTADSFYQNSSGGDAGAAATTTDIVDPSSGAAVLARMDREQEEAQKALFGTNTNTGVDIEQEAMTKIELDRQNAQLLRHQEIARQEREELAKAMAMKKQQQTAGATTELKVGTAAGRASLASNANPNAMSLVLHEQEQDPAAIAQPTGGSGSGSAPGITPALAPRGPKPKGWDQCVKFAREVKSHNVFGTELVRTWKSTCEPAVLSGVATERYKLMCDSLGGAVERFSNQVDYNVFALCDAVLTVFHDVLA